MDNLKLIVEKFSENNFEINHETFNYFVNDVINKCLLSFDNFAIESSNKAADFENEKARKVIPGPNQIIPIYSGEQFRNNSLRWDKHFVFFSLIKCFEYTNIKHKEALLKIENLEQEVKNNSFIINEHVFDIRDLYGKNRELLTEVKKIKKYVNGYMEETCSLKNDLAFGINDRLIFLESEVKKQQKIIYLLFFVFFILLSVLFSFFMDSAKVSQLMIK